MPVIPPGAPLSPNSSLYGRLAKGKDERGKTPGRRNSNGLWASFDWTAFECSEEDLDSFDVMGCSIGIKTGDGLIGVDLDSTDPVAAEWLYRLALEVLGPGAVRIGRYPKRLLLYRISAPIAYDKVRFQTATEQDAARPALVEILTEGRQFVAWGVHPVTGRPYEWPDGLPTYEDLHVITPEQMAAFMAAVAGHFPAAQRFSASSGDRAGVEQASLAGDPELVSKAVAALPNRSSDFPSRDDYLKCGYAIKAALPDDDSLAFDLWGQWCGRWDGGVNDPDVMEADWQRMKPPYGLGATWLYEQAERLGGWTGRVERWFQPITEAELAAAPAGPGQGGSGGGAVIEWRLPTAWKGVEPAPRKWIVHGLIPDNEVTLLAGDGGLGKTLLAQQLLTASTARKPWLGLEVAHRRCMGVFCEDGWDELHRRQIDIDAALGVELDSLEGMSITSRRQQDNTLALFDRDGEMRLTEVFKRLVIDARRFGAGLIVLDGLADMFAGNHNDTHQVKTFVNGALTRLVEEIGGAVIMLAHPSKAAMASGEGYGGSPQWHNAVRSRLYMHRPDKAKNGRGPAGDFRKLENMKLNGGRSGSSVTVKWERGAFTAVSSAMLTDLGDEGGVPDTATLAELALLEAIREAAGVAMSAKVNSRTRGDLVLVGMYPDRFAAFDREELRLAFCRLVDSGAVESVRAGMDEHRKPKWSLAVAGEAPLSAPGDLFE